MQEPNDRKRTSAALADKSSEDKPTHHSMTDKQAAAGHAVLAPGHTCALGRCPA